MSWVNKLCSTVSSVFSNSQQGTNSAQEARQVDLNEFIDPSDPNFEKPIEIDKEACEKVIANVLSLGKKIAERSGFGSSEISVGSTAFRFSNSSFASTINLAELKAVYIGASIASASGESNKLSSISQAYLRNLKETIRVNDADFESHFKKKVPFFISKLIRTPDEILANIRLSDLQQAGCFHILPLHDYPIWYGLAEKKPFLSRKIEDVQKCKDPRILPLIASRLDLLMDESKNEKDYSALTLGKLRTLSAQDIYSLPAALSIYPFRLLSIEQLKTLDFTKLSREKMDAAIEGPDGEGDLVARIWELNEGQRNIAIAKASSHIKSQILRFIKPEELKALDFDSLSTEQVDAVINGNGDEVLINLRLGLLSEKQLKRVFLSASKSIIDRVPAGKYACFPLKEAAGCQTFSLVMSNNFLRHNGKERFSYVPMDELSFIINSLDHYYLGLISEEQLRGLDYSRIKPAIFIHLFSTQEGVRKLACLSGFHFEQLLDKEIHEGIANMIPTNVWQEFPKEKIDQLRKKKGWKPEYLYRLSDGQLSRLHPASLSNAEIESLFPHYNLESLHPGTVITVKDCPITGTKRYEFSRRIEKTSSSHFYMNSSMISHPEEEVQRKLKFRKETCIKHLAIYGKEGLRDLLKERPDLQALIDQLSKESQ